MLALRAVRLFDGSSSALVDHPTVLVDGGKIVAVTAGGETPADAELHDLGDVTLLPGLIDTHVHLGFDAGHAPVAQMEADADDALLLRMRLNAQQALQAGITTVRDLGDRAFLGVALRDWFRAGAEVGPEIVAAGPPLTSSGGHCHFMGGQVAGEARMRGAVREWVDRGVDVIKVMGTGGNLTPGTDPFAPQFTPAEVAAVVDEAHALGRKVTVHSHAAVGMRLAIEAGADGIEHGMFWVEDGVKVDAAAVDRLAERGTWICPTAGVRSDRLQGAVIPPAVAARFAPSREVLATLHRAGVRLIAGSDAGVGTVKPHDVLPWTIGEMAGAGMGNVDALRSATSVAADACDMGDRKGRLAAGMDADIVAVPGDPRQDLQSLRDVRAVYRAGVRVR